MSRQRTSHDCPDCGAKNLRRKRVEEKLPKYIKYEYDCQSCGARFTGAETIEDRRAFGESEEHDKSIPLSPRFKRILEKQLLTTQ